jgi:hypothetical protein
MTWRPGGIGFATMGGTLGGGDRRSVRLQISTDPVRVGPRDPEDWWYEGIFRFNLTAVASAVCNHISVIPGFEIENRWSARLSLICSKSPLGVGPGHAVRSTVWADAAERQGGRPHPAVTGTDRLSS